MRLLATDMDSTLITIECIDEIGEAVGRKAEIAAITARAMRGEIEFTESLRRRVALLEGVPLEALESVYREKLRLSPGAERLIEACKAAGLKLMLVSGGFTFFTERLRTRLASTTSAPTSSSCGTAADRESGGRDRQCARQGRGGARGGARNRRAARTDDRHRRWSERPADDGRGGVFRRLSRQADRARVRRVRARLFGLDGC